ncbi:MAG: hypothetical protein ACR2G3_10195 [Solirubrobacterales bacterium]
MLVSWLLFPIVLAALCLGWGWLLAACMRVRVPRAVVPGLGMAGIVVAGQFLTLADPIAELATPVIAVLGGAGLVLGAVRRLGAPPGWAVAASVAVLAVYAAPIVLSGEATFAGFIKLDDTATWMAFTDRLMEHGRDLDGLAPSSYEATLAFNLADGYPVGVFVPLGAAAALVGEDVAWVIQPYMAFWAALLALALFALGRGAVRGARQRALVAAVAAQPALLFGYYLWGGIKEVAAIALIATVAALLPRAVAPGPSPQALPGALAVAALIGVLSGGGLIWVAPLLVAALAVCLRRLGPGAALRRAALASCVIVVGSVPVIVAGGLLPPTSSPLTDAAAIGNLVRPLDAFQVAGIWPAGDFRFDPALEWATDVLVILACVGAVAGVVVAARRRAWWAAAFVAGVLGAAGALALVGSPWVEAKAFASASVAIPFAALVAAAAAWRSGRRAAGAVVAVLVAGGVVWSNALAYRDVSLAPRERLAELERIGEVIAGEGPTLMTEYNPYGVRHFLREGEPESVSELRRRRIPLAGGDPVPKGLAADTDELSADDLLIYRSLVLRRSPARSRPPSPYRLRWEGESYELWQRPAGPPGQLERLSLGSEHDPAGRATCAEVRKLADRAGPAATLLAARPSRLLVLELDGAFEATARIRRQGAYGAWLQGSVRGLASLYAAGELVGSARHQLNHEGGYVPLGDVELAAGATRLRLELEGADLHPGSGGRPPAVGPLVIEPLGSRSFDPPVPEPVGPHRGLRRLPASRAEGLCGRRWDWVEAVTP